jgi:hypothetical protein
MISLLYIIGEKKEGVLFARVGIEKLYIGLEQKL